MTTSHNPCAEPTKQPQEGSPVQPSPGPRRTTWLSARGRSSQVPRPAPGVPGVPPGQHPEEHSTPGRARRRPRPARTCAAPWRARRSSPHCEARPSLGPATTWAGVTPCSAARASTKSVANTSGYRFASCYRLIARVRSPCPTGPPGIHRSRVPPRPGYLAGRSAEVEEVTEPGLLLPGWATRVSAVRLLPAAAAIAIMVLLVAGHVRQHAGRRPARTDGGGAGGAGAGRRARTRSFRRGSASAGPQ